MGKCDANGARAVGLSDADELAVSRSSRRPTGQMTDVELAAALSHVKVTYRSYFHDKQSQIQE